MRLRVAAWLLAGFVCIEFSSPAIAQFKEIDKAELQMTSDPKAPGAAAVILEYEEKDDDGRHSKGYYERIKVLTEKGVEAGTIRIPYDRAYFKVTGIAGRTVHPDGTVIPLTAKPADLMEVKSGKRQVNEIVFSLPEITTGSVLEFRLELEYSYERLVPPRWWIQQNYFTHSAHFTYLLPNRNESLSVDFHGRPGTNLQQDDKGNFYYDITDVPAVPVEEWMPPLNSICWRVGFTVSQYFDGIYFWSDSGKAWASSVEKYVAPGPAIRQAVSEIVPHGASDEQKARLLYDAVIKLENTSFTRIKSKAELKRENLKASITAEDVWNQKGGTSNELALLYMAMAKTAGLDVTAMKVVNRERALFDPDLFSLSQLDDFIVIVDLGGKRAYLDPGQPRCPFGLLQWKHTVARGLRDHAGEAKIDVTPGNTFTQNLVELVADLTLDVDGTVKGTIRIAMNGQSALAWRQLAIIDDEQTTRKEFSDWLRGILPQGIDVDFEHFTGLNDGSTGLQAQANVTGALGSASGKRMILPAMLFETRETVPFVTETTRTAPIDMHFPARTVEDVTYHLPSGYVVEGIPQGTEIPWPDHASFRTIADSAPNVVHIVRSLAYNLTMLDPNDYSNLHGFYQRIAAADQQQVVLSKHRM